MKERRKKEKRGEGDRKSDAGNFAISLAQPRSGTADLVEVVGDKLRLRFHQGQRAAWDSKARIIAIIAGPQSGKTSFTPHWLFREVQQCGPGDYLFATPTFPLLELKALPEFLHLFRDWLDLGRYTSSPRHVFRFSDTGCARVFGDRFDWRNAPETRVVFGYAEDPESLESMTANAAVLDEAGQTKFRVGSWEAVLQRLSLSQGRILITTKVYGQNWLKPRVYDRFRAGDKTIFVVQFDSTMNPRFPQEEFERARRDLPLWKFNMVYRGQFERPAGLIYDCWDDATQSVPRMTIPQSWRRYMGLDFGQVNTAATFWAEEPETNRLYCYRTYHAGNLSAAGHAKQLLHGEHGQPHTVGGSHSEDEWRKEFRAAGLAVREPKFKEVEIGIDRVYAAMQGKQLFIFDDLADLLEEVHTYSRKLDEAGNATPEIEDKETFHLLDSVRYIIGDIRGATAGHGVQAGIVQRADPLVEIDRGGF